MGPKSVPPTSSIKMRNCQKKLARVFAHTHAYTQIHDRGGTLCPPPPVIGLRLPEACRQHQQLRQAYWLSPVEKASNSIEGAKFQWHSKLPQHLTSPNQNMHSSSAYTSNKNTFIIVLISINITYIEIPST